MCLFSKPKVREPAPPPPLPPAAPPPQEDDTPDFPLVGSNRTVTKGKPKRGKDSLTIALAPNANTGLGGGSSTDLA